ncbi:hypothetical protein BDN70DRAFT_134352 [Pholiota conissans]|uniref:Uncharacterized protein n=1 Tax=Pholiota conissans TaxID=109636 RepID=A0A9P6CYU4_9AGAR|nr:hypothetical protein BDN70DRAFT_134352 [Pholiota conissans]
MWSALFWEFETTVDSMCLSIQVIIFFSAMWFRYFNADFLIFTHFLLQFVLLFVPAWKNQSSIVYAQLLNSSHLGQLFAILCIFVC